ncbi:lrgB family protein [Clostridium tetanomorphum]|nr:lrgB family protein [Clostridium tetanomorphum]
MIQEILNSPIFGILVSIIGFEIGLYIYRKTKIALFNPLLICIALIVCMLISFNIKLDYLMEAENLFPFSWTCHCSTCCTFI